MVVCSAARPRSASNSSTSRNDSEYRRYQRTAHRISSGAVCRHLKIVGRVACFTIVSAYQPPPPNLQHIPVNLLSAVDCPLAYRHAVIIEATVHKRPDYKHPEAHEGIV